MEEYTNKGRSIGYRYALALIIVPLASPVVVSGVQKTVTISNTALGPILIVLLTAAYAWCIWSIRNSPHFGPSEEEQTAYQIKALNDHSIINMTDEHGMITYVNDKFIQTTGYSRDELIGQNLTMLLPKAIAAQYNFAKSFVLTGKTWSGEVRMKGKGGQSIWTHSTVAPRFDKIGRAHV